MPITIGESPPTPGLFRHSKRAEPDTPTRPKWGHVLSSILMIPYLSMAYEHHRMPTRECEPGLTRLPCSSRSPIALCHT